ncbi:MAG: phospholipase D-like domain-containing protein [Casimicrobiaceae bacterium]
MAWPRKRIAWVVAASVAATAAITLIVVNLIPSQRRIVHKIERSYDTGSAEYFRSLGVLLGPPVLAGNSVQALQNGEEIFPAMLEAIRGAQRTISFESYIYWSGAIGASFAAALSDRARAGVRVHVLLDWVGSQKIEAKLLDDMRDAGVQIQLYHPLSWYHLARVNNRTHRKLLIVDGRIGFTGGVGIADKWNGHAQDADHWRDSQYRVEGPVVAQMQATFLDNWTKVSGDVLHGSEYLPSIAPAGQVQAQMFSSSPDGGADSMQLMYLLVTTAATKTINLATAYFVPDELTSNALVAAMGRGVRFRLIVPGPIIDSDVVRRASRSTWGPLLAAGAEIYEYQPTMFHCKVLIVDGLLVSVGSTNFDPRSFRLNDEANLNIYDTAFAAAQTAVFERDVAQSRRVTLAEWEDRPWHEKALEWTAGLLGSQL